MIRVIDLKDVRVRLTCDACGAALTGRSVFRARSGADLTCPGCGATWLQGPAHGPQIGKIVQFTTLLAELAQKDGAMTIAVEVPA